MKHYHITSESSGKRSPVTSDSSRKYSHTSAGSSEKHNHITSESSGKGSEITSESSRKYNHTIAKSSRKCNHITSESSRKHSHSTSESSKKDSEISSESSKKHSGITSESCRQHHHSMSLSSWEHRQSSTRHCGRSSGKGASRRRSLRSNPLSSTQPAGCLSSCQNSIVTGSGDLTADEQSPASIHSKRSSEANSANQSNKLSSSSSYAKTSAASSTNMECAVQDYSPLIVDATNISKSKGTYTSNVCSVVDTIIGKKSECVEVVRKLDNCVFKAPGRKRRHADSLAPQTVKAKVSDTLATCIHKQKSSRKGDTAAAHEHKQMGLQHKDKPATCKQKQKCSQLEDDSSSVIYLGSDDEVEIIDGDPKPQSGRSSVTDTVRKRSPETVIIDLCSPTVNSKYPLPTKKYMDRKDEKTSSSKYTFSEQTFKEYVSVLGDRFCTSSIRPRDVPPVASRTEYHGFVPLASHASASSASDPAVNSGVEKMQDCEVVFISSGEGGSKTNSASVCGSGVQNQCHSDVRKSLQAIDNRMVQTSASSSSAYGNNFYNPHPDTVRMGLRPIVIDGSNVAMGHSNGRIFSCRGLQICIDYFLQRKHRVVAFVPQFRRSANHSQDTAILASLEKEGLVSFTPSRRIGNQLVVPYDDRYIVQYAAECGGVIVSTDNYRDLLEENPAWRETIEMRLLMFTWVGDVIMFPQDPLGRHGPNLESFLRFPSDGYAEAL